MPSFSHGFLSPFQTPGPLRRSAPAEHRAGGPRAQNQGAQSTEHRVGPLPTPSSSRVSRVEVGQAAGRESRAVHRASGGCRMRRLWELKDLIR